ncbi:SulP family inorganic anion transporter [Curvibacter sp. HBC28]|uniref:SulP family inorganic anion transporter n=1 Tax=Curvibacter microcysteis TaxID=3026419 RepID=A0ABT5MH00_9BURK|nr:SulP family inorganic anion transporter [Curvibacter sp. HBC28]MDD0815853.1 SulP family inorganic anion transporter [Curvibacter sp. HBC28]
MSNAWTLARFHPRLLDSCRGYNRQRLWKDAGAGVTVGIVALPLAMAFAIASGMKPEAGLWTAIIAGFLISLLGGSSVQIGGPAGAFIVVVYSIIERYGLPNLLIATALAGVLLFAMGLLRLGTLVRYVPVTIVVGFTNGIAVLIALSQVKDLLGLQVPHMPADFFSQLQTLWQHRHSFNAAALGLGLSCVVGLFVWPWLWGRPHRFQQALDVPGMRRAMRTAARLPGPVVALVTLTLLAWLLDLPVDTIGSRFGDIPSGLPQWAWPDLSWDSAKHLLNPTLTIALLGAVESLLCARVADQIGDQARHDPNQELMAQGIANLVSPFFGGMPATGTIARTVTNIRSGATSPVSGLVHALVLAVIVLMAAPLALRIPLPVLSGILLFVAWNMGEWHEFVQLRHYSGHYRLVMLGTFFLTVVFDLTVAIEVGLVLACALFIRRMSSLFTVAPVSEGLPAQEHHYRLHGALFFGAVDRIDGLLSDVENSPAGLTVVLDAQYLVALDTTGLDALRQLHRVIRQRGGRLRLEQLQPQPQGLVQRSGFAAELALDGVP